MLPFSLGANIYTYPPPIRFPIDHFKDRFKVVVKSTSPWRPRPWRPSLIYSYEASLGSLWLRIITAFSGTPVWSPIHDVHLLWQRLILARGYVTQINTFTVFLRVLEDFCGGFRAGLVKTLLIHFQCAGQPGYQFWHHLL